MNIVSQINIKYEGSRANLNSPKISDEKDNVLAQKDIFG